MSKFDCIYVKKKIFYILKILKNQIKKFNNVKEIKLKMNKN